jgi:hypothetical protein
MKTETKVQFTPGPWQATELPSGLWNVHAANKPSKPPIAALDFSPKDARLIAAAPDMYEALVELTSYGLTDSLWEKAFTKAIEALRKAEPGTR